MVARLQLVVGDDDFGVPAGWYPDPLGLPQLRWWDGQSWTEFTSEAQAPVMMQASSFAPEPVPAAVGATERRDASVAGGASVGYVDATSVASPAQPVAATPVAEVTPEPVAAPSAAPFIVAPAEPAAAQPVAEPAVNVHNLGEQMQFLTRRERREYERRLEAEAELFPHAAAAAGPAAYIQQPVSPEDVPAARSAFAPEPVAPVQPASFVQEPLQAQPLQPEPLQPEPYRPEPFAAAFAAEQTPPPTSFADLIGGEPGGADPVAAASGALLVPAEPAPFLASGLRELEPALSEILAEAALAPLPASSHANTLPSGFDIDETLVEEEPAPERKVLAKRTYTFASWVLALSSIIQVALAYFVVFVLDQPTNRPVMAVIWFGGLIVAAGIAGYDRLLLKASGHERTATGWWALLTPLAYLIARSIRTRRETGRGALLVIVWIIASAAAAGLIYLYPVLFTAAIQ